jgi:CelD/BcsL family acetyltransferase involved in cellulose biosynthesis
MPITGSPQALAEVEVLTGTDLLEALRPEWEALWREDPRATPFHAPQWLLPWWKHIGRGEPCSLALRDDDGVLVGLAPLYVHTDADGVRHLFPLGIATTDYLGPLARRGWERRVAAAVVEGIRAMRERWDVFECPQLRRDAALLAAAGAQVTTGEPNPVLSLAPEPAIPRSTLANLRTCRNRAARVGTLCFERAQPGQVDDYLEALARLHERRWSERGLPGVLADDAVRAAHAEAAPQLQAGGMLRLHGLRLDGELVAVLYALFDPVPGHERRCYYYIAGFEPRHAFFSPGSLLLAHAIQDAAAEGATAFDFLRGAEAYKYRWGAVDQEMVTLRMRSPRCS